MRGREKCVVSETINLTDQAQDRTDWERNTVFKLIRVLRTHPGVSKKHSPRCVLTSKQDTGGLIATCTYLIDPSVPESWWSAVRSAVLIKLRKAIAEGAEAPLDDTGDTEWAEEAAVGEEDGALTATTGCSDDEYERIDSRLRHRSERRDPGDSTMAADGEREGKQGAGAKRGVSHEESPDEGKGDEGKNQRRLREEEASARRQRVAEAMLRGEKAYEVDQGPGY